MWFCLSGTRRPSLSDSTDQLGEAEQAGGSKEGDPSRHCYVEDPDAFQSLDESPAILPRQGFRTELGGLGVVLSSDGTEIRLEKLEKNSLYFREHFFGKGHTNLVGGDRSNPIVASVCLVPTNGRYRAVVRTKQDDYFVQLPQVFFRRRMISHLLQALPKTPQNQNATLSEVQSDVLSRKLLHMEDRLLVKSYKFGVLYSKEGQTNENDMFSNNEESPAFQDFLTLLGDVTKLQGYKGFRGGLDVEKNSTGEYTLTTKFAGFEIMYHVSTKLPYSEENRQQLERKRHIGNDVVVIVFQEGSTPFDPAAITSKFNHVYIVVQYDPARFCKDGTKRYQLGVASKRGVGVHGPVLPEKPIFEHGPGFREFLLTKMINSERAAYEAPGFLQTLTRRDWLRELLDEFGG